MKNHYRSLFIAVVSLTFLVSAAHAVSLNWTEKDKTLVIDDTVQITKPDKKWDTQTTHNEESPVKWVYHQSGANPVITLKYRKNVTGATAHIYAAQVAKELAKEGIKVNKTEDKVIRSRNVAIIYGVKKDSGEHYVVGVWRHKDKGFILEAQSAAGDFTTFKPQFTQAIESVRILKETSK